MGKSDTPLTPKRRAELAEQRIAELERALAQEQQRSGAMAAKLAELGVSLDFLSPAAPASPPAIAPTAAATTAPQITAIYTDGACAGNPGPGGWGTVLYLDDGTVHELGGAAARTTNNRMELQAAIAALQILQTQSPDAPVALYTDSEYVKNGITKWIRGWKKKGWKTAAGKPVLNQDLWEQLDALNQPWVEWHYVRGHTGNVGNERCDAIARQFSQGQSPHLQQHPNFTQIPQK